MGQRDREPAEERGIIRPGRSVPRATGAARDRRIIVLGSGHSAAIMMRHWRGRGRGPAACGCARRVGARGSAPVRLGGTTAAGKSDSLSRRCSSQRDEENT